MLIELAVHDLGVIADLSLVLGPGMTAVTGETGAGKTLLVEAVELLVGGRGDATLVRPGADECRVEGRFLHDGDETVLTRVVPRTGRSRAYVDGRMAPVSALAELGARLVDLHGQHAHQSLLAPAVQRAALDRFAGVDLEPRHAARARRRDLEARLAALGGDATARAREADLLRHQVAEVEAAGLHDPDEDRAREDEEDRLADAEAHRAAGAAARGALADDGAAADRVGEAIARLAERRPFADLETRLRAVAAELVDVAAELRAEVEAIDDDPERLARVRARRQLLRDLGRKYGHDGEPGSDDDGAEMPGSVGAVLAFARRAAARLATLDTDETQAAALEGARQDADTAVAVEEALVAAARQTAAPSLAAAVEGHLQQLALPQARVEVRVDGDGPADQVAFLLGPNPGEPVLPLAKIASGGELARAMLALRLVLSEGPSTLLFDEVDAGIGGEAAVAVGRALAALAADHQVLVVTHLPQVAAFADQQVAVTKHDDDGRTVTRVAVLDDAARVGELSRMLAGALAGDVAHDHAEELLATAARQRGR